MPSPAPPAPKRRRLKSAERKKELIEAAIRLFSEGGFQGTTTRRLASAAGISEALLYRHFATKEQLYDAIIDDQMRDTPRSLPPALRAAAARNDDQAVMKMMGELILRTYRRQPAYIRLQVYSALEGHGLSLRFFERQVRGHYEFLIAYFRKRIAAGAFRKAHPAAAARAWMGMVNHHGLVRTLFRDSILSLSDARALDVFAALFLGGIRKP